MLDSFYFGTLSLWQRCYKDHEKLKATNNNKILVNLILITRIYSFKYAHMRKEWNKYSK